jgi:hypothetical protein
VAEPQDPDILLVEGVKGSNPVGSAIKLQADWVTCSAHDFLLDNPDRHKGNSPPADIRRALVHDVSGWVSEKGVDVAKSDRLAINFNGDYPDGVWVYDRLYIQAKMPMKEDGTPDLTAYEIGNPELKEHTAGRYWLRAVELDGNNQANLVPYSYIDVLQQFKEIREAIATIRVKLGF